MSDYSRFLPKWHIHKNCDSYTLKERFVTEAADFERHEMNLKRIYALWFLSTWSVKFGDSDCSAQKTQIRKEAEIACSPNLSNHRWWVDLDNIKRTSFIVHSVAWLWLYVRALGRQCSDEVRRACRGWKWWGGLWSMDRIFVTKMYKTFSTRVARVSWFFDMS